MEEGVNATAGTRLDRVLEIVASRFPLDMLITVIASCKKYWTAECYRRAVLNSAGNDYIPVKWLLAMMESHNDPNSIPATFVELLGYTRTPRLNCPHNGWTILQHAIYSHHVPIVRALAMHPGIDLGLGPRPVYDGRPHDLLTFAAITSMKIEFKADSARAKDSVAVVAAIKDIDGNLQFHPLGVPVRQDGPRSGGSAAREDARQHWEYDDHGVLQPPDWDNASSDGEDEPPEQLEGAEPQYGQWLPPVQSTHLYWVCKAGVPAVVDLWLDTGAIPPWVATSRLMPGSTVAPAHVTLLASLMTRVSDSGWWLQGRTLGTATCLTRLAIRSGAAPDEQYGDTPATYLHLACSLGLHELLQHWIEHDRDRVLSVLNMRAGLTGYIGTLTPFGVSCEALERAVITDPRHELFRKCATLLGDLPQVDGAVSGARGCSQLYLACLAGLPQVVNRMLADESCTAMVVNAVQDEFRTAFHALCSILEFSGGAEARWGDEYGAKVEVRYQHLTACAISVGTSGKCRPGVNDANGHSHALLACRAGLHEVLRYWMEHGLADLNMAVGPDRLGPGEHTPFTACCSAARAREAVPSRERFEACAAMLVGLESFDPAACGPDGHSQLFHACVNGLHVVVQRIVDRPGCPSSLVDRCNANRTAFSMSCAMYEKCMDSGRLADLELAGRRKACAMALVTSSRCWPGARCTADGMSQLFAACRAGLTEAVTWWTEQGYLGPGHGGLGYVAETFKQSCVPYAKQCDVEARGELGEEPNALATAVRECLVAIGTLPVLRPCTTDMDGGFCLFWAAMAGLHEVLQRWVEHDHADLLAQLQRRCILFNQHTAFTYPLLSAYSAPLANRRRDGFLACARLLAGLPGFDPDALGGEGYVQYPYACLAGLDDLVLPWVQAGRCKPAHLTVMGSKGTMSRVLCKTMVVFQSDTPYRESLAPRIRACLVAVVTSDTRVLPYTPWCGTLEEWNVMQWACAAGLHEVLEHWVTRGLLFKDEALLALREVVADGNAPPGARANAQRVLDMWAAAGPGHLKAAGAGPRGT